MGTADTIRRRDAARTRATVLAAAQAAFASRGYAQVGLRDVAAAAGIDAALVRRYFGSKEGLFEAALSDALDLDALLASPRDRIGRHIATLLIDGQEGRTNPLPILLMAMADPVIRPVALALLHSRIIDPLERWIGTPDASARAARVSILCSGFFTYYRLLPLRHFASGVDPATRAWLAEALQAAID